jgi:GT2 family glycosyltransferase
MKSFHKAKKAAKLVAQKTKGRTVRNFYKGQSLPKTAFKAARFMIKKGPLTTARRLRNEFIFGSKHYLTFPNGLASGTDLAKAATWYAKHAKPVVIVIPSYNDYELLRACVDSIAANTKPGQYDIIIVDDYCQPLSRQMLKTFETEHVQVVYRKENGGYGKAVNTGWRKASRQFPKRDVILLNSDIVAHPNWLTCLQYGAYEHDKRVGIVGPKLLYPDGRIQSAGSYRNTEDPEWFDHYYRFQAADYGPANVPQYCIGVTGACMYIKRSVIRKLGYFDEQFPFAFEDVDYCLRAWEAGIRSLYYPAAELTHVESATRAKNKTMSEREKGSVRYFWHKWGDWFDKRPVTDEQGRVRIIYVLQTTGVSGGIRVVFEHLNRLQAMGYSVELWALDKHPVWTNLQVPTRTFKNYELLTEALAEEDAIKVATWWETALPVWLASVRRGIPAYFVQEIESWFYPDQPEAQRAVIACYRKEFKNLTTSKYNLEEIRSLGLKASTAPCGYDHERYKLLPDVKREPNTVLAVGRSFFQKNFTQTLEAWKLLKRRPKLLLFGSEPKIAGKERPVEYVFKPSDTGVNVLYNRATVFVQTSYHEGFCLPVLEAMAAGAAVICTDAHGNRDFCFDGKNCLMVPKDDPEALARLMRRLLKDTVLRDKLVRAGLETTKKYRWPTVMKQVATFYNEVAAQPDRGRVQKALKKYQ